ncbi:MAG: ABC transporter permease, partial [Muribaculaceae bacterium]|nr:ABC transporter permease [Muribaculaceae bacterium]
MGFKYIFKRLMAEWKANVWLAVELLIVSVVIWVIVDQLYVQTSRVSEDPGFDISDTFLVSVETINNNSPEFDANYASDSAWAENRREMIERLRRRPEVEYVGLSRNSYPYDGSNSGTSVRYISEEGDTISKKGSMVYRVVSPDFIRVFRYRGANGETPDELAELLEKNPAAIMLSSNVFGEDFDMQSLVGKEVERYNGEYEPVKVSAILNPVKYTEYDNPVWSTSMVEALEPGSGWFNEITVRVKEGMSRDFIENLLADSEKQFRVGNLYIANVQSFYRIAHAYTLGRQQATRNKFIVMTFLLVNIFLGLLGTFWFRTRQRTPEIALMKVTGATAST